MSKSIFRNLSYNVLLQVVLMVLPLISIPYVSRVLGPEGIGAYSFTLSLTQYFIIVGTLGTALYGNRQIAYTRDHKNEMTRTFWSIFLVRMFSTSIALISYHLIFWNANDYQFLRFIQSFHILAQMFDITWLYIGLEDFKRIVTRNLFVKLIGLAMIFIFVQTKEDVVLYTFINLGMSVFSSLIMWLYVPKLLIKVQLNYDDIKKHIKPIFNLFIPQLASQVYVLLDKTMLGYLSNISQVGFYTQAERIVRSILELTSALGVVMLPRMSHIHSLGQKDQMKIYLNKSLKAVSYIAIPMSAGVIAVTPQFVSWFLGPGYEAVEPLMMSISSILIFISLSSVLGVQYLLPSNRIKEFTLSIVSGALVNLILNLLLIPRLAALGAVIGTISAELTVMSIQLYFLRSEIHLKEYALSVFKYSFSSLVMFIVVYFIGEKMNAHFYTNIIQVFAGIIVYLSLLSLLKDEIHTFLIELIQKGVAKLKKA